MKIRTNFFLIFLVALTYWAGLCNARAFYDSGAQRWLNRDPLGDGGSLVYAIALNQTMGLHIEELEMLNPLKFDHVLPNADLSDLSIFPLNGAVHAEEVEGPNMFQVVGNMPVGSWDAFGLAKGGKQNISCEGFNKQSDPKLVKEALDAAKTAGQAKRAKALAGLWKVIKRGGTMMWLWIDYSLLLLNNAIDGEHRGNCTAYYESKKNMTSDGINTEDWEVVQDYAAKIANAACADDAKTSDIITEKLLRYLECLEAKYGKLPSILATRADYVNDLTQRVKLLEQSYELAKQSDDRENLTLTASSLAQLYVEEAVDVSAAQKWLALLADALESKWDDLEYQEFQKLTTQVESLNRRGKPDFLA